MNPRLREVEPFLAVLKMKTDKAPSFEDLKKAYHDLLHLHPDKAGSSEENTRIFQEITEAARKVFSFITNNPDLQSKRGSADFKRMLKCFEESSNLKFHDGGVVFFFDDEQYDDWVKALGKYIAPPTNLNKSEVNFLFSTDRLEIPEHPNHGNVTASLYYKPKSDGKSKIMLQGAAHLAFLSFVIPAILKEFIYKKAPELKEPVNATPAL